MTTPTPQQYTAPVVLIGQQMRGWVSDANLLVTILEDGSLVIGSTPEDNAKSVASLTERLGLNSEGN